MEERRDVQGRSRKIADQMAGDRINRDAGNVLVHR